MATGAPQAAATERLVALTVLVVGVSLAASLAYVGGTLGVRPLDGVEGEVLYEAHRLRMGLPLYIDPVAGALDEGPVPARFFVLYPPVWSWLVSFVPEAWAAAAGRCAGAIAWFGVLATVASTALPARRRVAWTAAAFVGGIYTLTLFGASARPDAVAVALAGLGLARALRLGRVDAGCGALFALGAWIKPNVWGIAAGAMVAGWRLDRRSALHAVGASLGTSAVISAVLQRASGGAWLDHLVQSTGQPMMLSVWLKSAAWRFQFQGAPLAVAVAAGWNARGLPAVRIATYALLASLAWALVSLDKIGSASNYWMEPLLAAVAVVSQAPLPALGAKWMAPAAAAAALLQAIWTGVANVRSSIEGIEDARERAALVATARRACGARPSDLIVANEPGLELMLNGRLLATPFQLMHLARRGRYPLLPWIHDIERPEVRCALMQTDEIDRDPGIVRIDQDGFPAEVRRALRAKFKPIATRAGWTLYALRDEGAIPR